MKKGARSYYPLFCTVAQTGQFFDMHHRPGNVHDSKGAAKFMAECFTQVLKEAPEVRMESRMDSAFYSDTIFETLSAAGAEFSCSVPFQRIPVLKEYVESRKRWRPIDEATGVFEKVHQAASWDKAYRLIFVRTKRAKQVQGPLQLHLFEPRDSVYEYKVFATNKTESADAVLAFHNGRGSQERIFGEGKQHAALDVLATRTKVGNQLFTACSMLAHNLGRELQMAGRHPKSEEASGWKALWAFFEMGTLRQRLLHRAGVLSRPSGKLSIRMSANSAVSAEMTETLERLDDRPVRSAA